MPFFEGADLEKHLLERNSISEIQATFTITYERDNTEIRGDGIVTVSRNGDLNLRIYSFGFLALEITSENGIVRSSPAIDRSRGMILTGGIRNCFFWWDNYDTGVGEKEGMYFLRGPSRTAVIDRKTFLPVRQKVFLGEGREMDISYEGIGKKDGIWYPEKIRIELLRHSVTLKITEISFSSVTQPKVDCDSLYDRVADDRCFK
jgi:hypothetical protein